MARKAQIRDEDIGAAMIAWYQQSLEKYPEGLVSQAQAATMLGISRVSASRLVARGHLNAVYFPKPPDIDGFAVSRDDPFWLKVLDWFDADTAPTAFPKVVYVSFGDVVDLWKSGDVAEKCRINWQYVFSGFDNREKRLQLQKAAIIEKGKNSTLQ